MNAATEHKSSVKIDSPVIVALDYDNAKDALAFVDRIDPRDCRLKVGKEMFTFNGPQFVKLLQDRGFEIFLDLKFHDIPNTVARAVAASAEMGVWMVNVHASGGARMMEAAKAVLNSYGKDAPLLTAVTVLTSMDQGDLAGIGLDVTPAEQAERLALLAKECGLDGVVCSAHEAAQLKARCGAGFKLVTPGIRPVGSETGDQRRIMTPQDAAKAGVDYMVIGRPITRSEDPAQTLKQINLSLKAMRDDG